MKKEVVMVSLVSILFAGCGSREAELKTETTEVYNTGDDRYAIESEEVSDVFDYDQAEERAKDAAEEKEYADAPKMAVTGDESLTDEWPGGPSDIIVMEGDTPFREATLAEISASIDMNSLKKKIKAEPFNLYIKGYASTEGKEQNVYFLSIKGGDEIAITNKEKDELISYIEECREAKLEGMHTKWQKKVEKAKNDLIKKIKKFYEEHPKDFMIACESDVEYSPVLPIQEGVMGIEISPVKVAYTDNEDLVYTFQISGTTKDNYKDNLFLEMPADMDMTIYEVRTELEAAVKGVPSTEEE